MLDQYADIAVGRKAYWYGEYSKMSFFDSETENNIGYPDEYLTAVDTGWNPSNLILTKGE
jgi:hypothetical protein